MSSSSCTCRQVRGHHGWCFCAYLDDICSVFRDWPGRKPWRSAHSWPLRASILGFACSFCRSILFWGSSQPMSGSTSAGGSPRSIVGSERLLFWRGLFHQLAGSWRPCGIPRKRSWQLLGWMLSCSIECLSSGTANFVFDIHVSLCAIIVLAKRHWYLIDELVNIHVWPESEGDENLWLWQLHTNIELLLMLLCKIVDPSFFAIFCYTAFLSV